MLNSLWAFSQVNNSMSFPHIVRVKYVCRTCTFWWSSENRRVVHPDVCDLSCVCSTQWAVGLYWRRIINHRWRIFFFSPPQSLPGTWPFQYVHFSWISSYCTILIKYKDIVPGGNTLQGVHILSTLTFCFQVCNSTARDVYILRWVSKERPAIALSSSSVCVFSE